jgi:hypothetical protein
MSRDQPTETHGQGWTTLVVVSELLLWPQSVGDRVVTAQEAGEWPAFALVVGEDRDLRGTPAQVLLDLLERGRRSAEVVTVTGRGRWTVVDADSALLRLRLHARSPVAFDVDILVPAIRVLGLLPAVARGAAIGLTTHRHVRELGDTLDVREVLRHVVLVRCQPVPELTELADELIWSCRT